MNYDLHCYKSPIGKLDIEEARKIYEGATAIEISPTVKDSIVQELMDADPSLTKFEFDQALADELELTNEDGTPATVSLIDLTTDDELLPIRIIVADNNIHIMFPQWNTHEESAQVIKKIDDYLRIISSKDKFYVYAPGVDKVFDPITNDFISFLKDNDLSKWTDFSSEPPPSEYLESM